MISSCLRACVRVRSCADTTYHCLWAWPIGMSDGTNGRATLCGALEAGRAGNATAAGSYLGPRSGGGDGGLHNTAGVPNQCHVGAAKRGEDEWRDSPCRIGIVGKWGKSSLCTPCRRSRDQGIGQRLHNPCHIRVPKAKRTILETSAISGSSKRGGDQHLC